MIRTSIEVEGKDTWEHGRNLCAALNRLGFEPKRDPEIVAWQCHLIAALRDKGLEPADLVEDYRARHNQVRK